MAREPRDIRDWLNDIVSWGDQAARYVDDMSESDFLSDRRTQDAVVRCLECVGEAAGKLLSGPDREELNGLQLYEAYWARNRLAHGYYDLNMSRVWETATVSLPNLVAHVRTVLRRLDS